METVNRASLLNRADNDLLTIMIKLEIVRKQVCEVTGPFYKYYILQANVFCNFRTQTEIDFYYLKNMTVFVMLRHLCYKIGSLPELLIWLYTYSLYL